MALSVRRSSEWSIVLCTEAGQVIKFDRQNLRLRTSQSARQSAAHDQKTHCPLCHQKIPASSTTSEFSTAFHEQSEAVLDTAKPFVHPEYFGFLALSFNGEDAIELEEEEDQYVHLSSAAFNQGYCARFFVEEGFLGRGGKAEVVKVRHVLEGVSLGIFALKRVAVGNSQTWLMKTLQEVQSLRFKHPNLVSYNHVWLERRQAAFSPMVPVLHILQEYCDGGDLESFVFDKCGKSVPTVEQIKEQQRRRSRGEPLESASNTSISSEMVYSFFKDILAGLGYLHNQGMLHRDMKSSNCLVDRQVLSASGFPRILVSDFGEAQLITSTDERSGGTGTLSYTAPEILRGDQWTPAADLFSLGIILYFLVHNGDLPYQSKLDDLDALREEILAFDGYRTETSNCQGVIELGTVLSELLSPHPLNRPSCAHLQAKLQAYKGCAASTDVRTADKNSHDTFISTRENKWPVVAQASVYSGDLTKVHDQGLVASSLVELHSRGTQNSWRALIVSTFVSHLTNREITILSIFAIRIAMVDACSAFPRIVTIPLLLSISLAESNRAFSGIRSLLYSVVACFTFKLLYTLYEISS